MLYQYLRLSLAERDLPLWRGNHVYRNPTTRTEYLDQIFSDRIDFEVRKKSFVYVPVGRVPQSQGDVLLGRIGRTVNTTETRPPENAFEEVSREDWKASNVAIDIGDHQDGQKIAFQFRRDVGNPLHVTTHLASHLNRRYSANLQWIIQVEFIKQNRDFWEAIERHSGEISRAEFEFVTPNLFGSRGELSESMKRLRRRHNAVKVTGVLHNPNGELDLQRDNLEEVVDYISKGGGHAKLKASKTTIYDSDEKPKTIRIDDDRSLHPPNVDFWNRLVRRLFGF